MLDTTSIYQTSTACDTLVDVVDSQCKSKKKAGKPFEKDFPA